jgi:hypothetical protein
LFLAKLVVDLAGHRAVLTGDREIAVEQLLQEQPDPLELPSHSAWSIGEANIDTGAVRAPPSLLVSLVFLCASLPPFVLFKPKIHPTASIALHQHFIVGEHTRLSTTIERLVSRSTPLFCFQQANKTTIIASVCPHSITNITRTTALQATQAFLH